MRRQRILVYSGDPGGAEALAPVLKWFPDGWDAKIIGKASALPIFRRTGMKATDCSGWTWLEIERLCLEWAPTSMLISASSLPEKDSTEMRLREWGKQRHTPVVAVIDSWQNYALRFTDPESKKIAHLPDRIAVMDEGAAKDMVADGLPGSILMVTGHPGLEEAGNSLRSRRMVEGKGELRICHFSQPIRDFWGNRLGYDEFLVARDLIGLVPVLESGLKRKIRLSIKLHPKESRSQFRKEVGRLPAAVEILPPKSDPLAALVGCDVAIGMGTIMLIKAVLGGVPAVCYAPGKASAQENSCIIAKRRFIPTARTRKILLRILSGLATGKVRSAHLEKQERFGSHQGAAENVFQLVKGTCP